MQKIAEKIIRYALALTGYLIFVVLMTWAIVAALERQDKIDYLECLSWQKDGHSIQCDPSKYFKDGIVPSDIGE
ncbi:MAG: hypothetical protein Q4C68_06840 [Moraxella sp.]|nr:hypothetical protein [Moraxella sp.]